MKNTQSKKKHFFGTATIGEKGQVVVPAEARTAMKLKKGDKLLVFGVGDDTVTLTKLARLEKFASHLEGRLTTIRRIIKKTEPKKS
ncbi:MAG: AbrB/MazE/SpoVT family DNA-binding domain-containing protein [Candidatus Azambacteria bacterium]|nr:AbrB/MazE/SpoVT family DNA-binding domain-containing protein [Candidatus Azambacteria bacterium]